jgi:integrase-like protein
VAKAQLRPEQHLFPSRTRSSPHLSTRQYGRIVGRWVAAIGLDPAAYGTHTMRRTKATLIYRRTKNLRAVQLLLGHTKLESTVRYLGIEVDDALEIAVGARAGVSLRFLTPVPGSVRTSLALVRPGRAQPADIGWHDVLDRLRPDVEVAETRQGPACQVVHPE